jgi:hypothetical protein
MKLNPYGQITCVVLTFGCPRYKQAHFLTHEGYLGAMGALITENKTVYEKSREFYELKKKEWSEFWRRWPTSSAPPTFGSGSKSPRSHVKSQ